MRQKPVPFAALNHIPATDAQLADDQDVIVPVDIISENRSRRATLSQIRGVSPGSSVASWQGEWSDGAYLPGQIVRDYNWLMIANKDTTDKAGPTKSGDPVYALPDSPAWATNSSAQWVRTGNRFVINSPVKVAGFRLWVPTITPEYTVYGYSRVYNPNDGEYSEDIVALPSIYAGGEWHEQSLEGRWLTEGTIVEVGIIAINHANEAVYMQVPWIYGGTSQTGNPDWNRWNTNNQDTMFRVNAADADSVNRDTELTGILDTDTFSVTNEPDDGLAEWRYAVGSNPGNVGGSYAYPATKTLTNGSFSIGQRCLLNVFRAGDDTDYVQLANHWLSNVPPWASSADGLIATEEGTAETLSKDAFGADLLIQDYTWSDAWDLMALSAF